MIPFPNYQPGMGHIRERQTTPPLLVGVFVIVWVSMIAIGIVALVV